MSGEGRRRVLEEVSGRIFATPLTDFRADFRPVEPTSRDLWEISREVIAFRGSMQLYRDGTTLHFNGHPNTVVCI